MSTVAAAEDSFSIQFRANEIKTQNYHTASPQENIPSVILGSPVPDYLNLPKIP